MEYHEDSWLPSGSALASESTGAGFNPHCVLEQDTLFNHSTVKYPGIDGFVPT